MEMGKSSISSFHFLAYALFNLFILIVQFTSSLPIPQNMTSERQLCHHDQSNALLHFKKTIKVSDSMCYPDPGVVGANLDTWKEGSDCCSWEGVTCNEVSGHVVELDLSCAGLEGDIRSNSSLFHLPHLLSLNLAYNYFPVFQLSSNFGEELKYLNLSVSLPSPFVPPEAANLLKLETLVISGYSYKSPLIINNFTLLLQQLTNLQILIVNNVNFNENIMQGITNLTKLIRLELRRCDVGGELVSVNFSKLEKLEHLNLDYNEFRGGFPVSLGNLSKLSYLSLRNNNLTGQVSSIPNGFQALSTMKLDWNSFEGPIPSWVFNLSSLKAFHISNNLLVGPLPSNNITWSQKLLHLNLSSNALTGTIPSAIFALPSLVSFSVRHNNLTGYVGEFKSLMLQKIELCYNSFEGGNFSSFSKLVNLQELDLSSNKLSGTFELDVFSSLRNLEIADLSQNIFLSLNGRNNTVYSPLPNLMYLGMSNCNANVIPFFIRNLVAIDTLDLSHNNIHGLLPEWLQNTSITEFMLSGNSITGGIPNLPFGCYVDLSFNSVRSLERNLSCTAGIDLSHNFIETGLQNLHQINESYGPINLSFNEIGGALPRNISVSTLNLSHNFLETVAENQYWIVGHSLDLSFNELGGALPGNISMTESLDLSHNYLESGVENLPLIHADYADLSFNKLIGEVNGNISISSLNLSHNYLTGAENIHGNGLYALDLSFNNLQGRLPVPSGGNGIVIYLVSNNKLSGKIHPNVCTLVNLFIINLSYNSLSGEIPDCMLKLPPQIVSLRRNNLSGMIPQMIGSNILNLDLSYNKLQGIIPRSLANCSNLEILDLSNNLIYDSFPTWLEGMQYLKALMLGSNKLYGNLSPSKSLPINVSTTFTQLRVIDVSNNNLYGNLPSHYFQSWKSMMKDGEVGYYAQATDETYYVHSVNLVNKGLEMEYANQLIFLKAVDFSNNMFGGVIPESIGNLSSLIVLNLSGNHLSGEIPSSIGNMVQLNSLDLSNNKLSGKIPGTLSSLTFLGAFNVSENNLEGPIPQGGQLTTFSNDSFKGNPDLCGIPLSIKCGVPNSPPMLGPEEEEDESLVDGFTWESVAIGYGCGFILGILGGVLLLKRYTEFVLRIFNIKLHHRIKRTQRQR